MKVLKANRLNMKKFEGDIRKYVKSRNILDRQRIETSLEYRTILRPFRRVMIEIESPDAYSKKYTQTLIDEELAPYVEDQNHQMLLWRPRYAAIEPVQIENTKNSAMHIHHNDKLQQIVTDMLNRRLECQRLDEEYQPKLKKLQGDSLSTLAMFIPRRSSSLKREQIVINERKEPHAYILASSLITNSIPRDVIVSSSIEERVFVETIVVQHCAGNGPRRLMILETPGTESIDDAIKAGRALSRLCELYEDCREMVMAMSNSCS